MNPWTERKKKNTFLLVILGVLDIWQSFSGKTLWGWLTDWLSNWIVD